MPRTLSKKKSTEISEAIAGRIGRFLKEPTEEERNYERKQAFNTLTDDYRRLEAENKSLKAEIQALKDGLSARGIPQ